MTLPGLTKFNESMTEAGWAYDENRHIWEFVGIKPTIEERLADLPPYIQSLVEGIGQ